MSKINIAERLAFIAKKFDVFEATSDGSWDYKSKELFDEGHAELLGDDITVSPIHSAGCIDMLALMSSVSISKVDSRDGSEVVSSKIHVSVSYNVFVEMLSADPTDNKIYLQWMLTVFTRLIKNERIGEAIRFASEDLPLAKEYLKIFEDNKKKKKFKQLCRNSYVLTGVKDPTNINQYKSLSQLYDAVDPFIERDPSDMERQMQKFVDAGQGLIPVRDRKFTVFIPLTRDANVIFDKFASWCTAVPGNGMFKSYTEGKGNKKPSGENSNIYIVINNKFFDGELKDSYLYQLHFESRQVRNRKQNGRGQFFEDVISQSEGVSNFFHHELTNMAKEFGGVDNNIYVDYLIKFGWTEVLFDMQDEFTPVIKFKDREVPKIPNISKFKELHTLIVAKGKLHELHPSIGDLPKLKELLLPNNNLKVLPKEIGNLKNLIMLNILGNNIKVIPDEIKYLDETNGGSLYRIACSREEIGEVNYQKLKKLLPSVKM